MANRTIHNKLIRPIKLKKHTAPVTTIKPTNSAFRQKNPAAVVKNKTLILPKAKRINASRSTKRAHYIQKPATIAVKGAPSINEDKINRLKNSKVGKILVIVGNGPSIATSAIDKLLGHQIIDIMSINKPDKRLWPTQYWLFCDNSQYRRHTTMWNNYKGTIINASCVTKTKDNVIRIKTLSGKGFSQNLAAGFYLGRSSVYASMQVGLWMGYDQIYLFGVDMGKVDGKLYPWGSNPDVKDHVRQSRFKTEARYYEWAAANLKKDIRDKFHFCSKYNKFQFVNKFNRLDEQLAPDIILNNANELERNNDGR